VLTLNLKKMKMKNIKFQLIAFLSMSLLDTSYESDLDVEPQGLTQQTVEQFYATWSLQTGF
jgi:hypothetical protein